MKPTSRATPGADPRLAAVVGGQAPYVATRAASCRGIPRTSDRSRGWAAPIPAASVERILGVARREGTKTRNPIEVSPRASWAGMSVRGSVWVGMGVSVLGPVHQFGSMDDVPLGVVQVGQRRREQPVLLAIDVVVQQGDHRLDPGQVARGDGVE